MPDSEWSRLLTERFPPRDTETNRREWDALKQRLPIGQIVTGTVIAKAPFGAWLDIGVGFPALLLIPHIEGLTPERYRADEWCPLGSRVKAFVGGFTNRNFQIGVWQVRPEKK